MLCTEAFTAGALIKRLERRRGAKRFKVVFSPAAQHDTEKLEIGIALQLAKDVRNYLEISPFPFGKTRIKRLTGLSRPFTG